MDNIQYNNKERLKALSSAPAKDMTKREQIALDTLTALIISIKPNNDEELDVCIDKAILLADKLIKKLNE